MLRKGGDAENLDSPGGSGARRGFGNRDEGRGGRDGGRGGREYAGGIRGARRRDYDEEAMRPHDYYASQYYRYVLRKFFTSSYVQCS